MKALDEILNLLSEEERIFERMFALKLSERSALAGGDTRGIEASTRGLEQAGREVAELEEARAQLAAQLARAYGVREEDLTLSRLAELAGSHYREPLLAAAARLSELLRKLELLNRQNAVVLRENLALLNEAVMSLAESDARGLEAYTPAGAAPGRRVPEARLLDRRA